ncbi:hypothetical protein [Rhodococcus opacus]|uniref:hypothetical protein n=1 Tax=Rhodococcus opacus TaxID=37919 RepID=UPI002A59A973|nr:hypothetical protein [Rhodococcus opacus]
MSTDTPAWNIDTAAGVLLRAEETRTDPTPPHPTPAITDYWPDLDVDTAYRVQAALIARKVAQGEKIFGVELGLTSRAKQQRWACASHRVVDRRNGALRRRTDPHRRS